MDCLYNAKGELTGEDFTPDDQLLPPVERDYLYNAAGNITDFNGTERRYNGANQLTQEWVNGQWETVAQYDDRGNPTTYREHDIEYDQSNHLTSFDETLTAGYSGDGRRIWKEVNGERVFFIYDGDTLIGEMDEYGSTTAVNTIGTTGLISRQTGSMSGNPVYYLFDPLGNVLHRLDGDGDIVSSDIYDAWGKREYSDDLTGDPYGYKGQYGYYTDQETGLILCTHRYYDPETGRWLTKDPIGHEGGVNLYGYCGNDPVNGVDPSGFKTYLFLWGEDSDGKPFHKAILWLVKHTKMKPEDSLVIAHVSTFDDFNLQLQQNKEIIHISYVGHGGPGFIFPGIEVGSKYNIGAFPPDRGTIGEYGGFEYTSVYALDKNNVLEGATIRLYACGTGVMSLPDEHGSVASIAQAFANKFEANTLGAVGSVVFVEDAQPICGVVVKPKNATVNWAERQIYRRGDDGSWVLPADFFKVFSPPNPMAN